MSNYSNQDAYHSCFRKRLFWSEQEARDEAQRMVDAGVIRRGRVYACVIGNHGEHFHITHRREDERAHTLDRLRTFGRQTVLTGA
jgi:hypothetical protein